MLRTPLAVAVFVITLAALPSPAPGDALRDTARVVAATRTTLYIDAGTLQGLREGQSWTTQVAGRPVTVRVVAVSGATAVVTVEGLDPAMPLAVGAEISLPPGRSAPPTRVGPRETPRAPARWVPELAASALPRILVDPGADVVTSASRRRTELLAHGEISARASFGGDLRRESRPSETIGISNDLSLEYGSWTWDHMFDLSYAARPVLLSQPLQNGALRFDVYLARLGWASESKALALSLGRQNAAEGTSAGMVDGGRVSFVASEDVELGAWAGARPDTLDLSPELRAPSAGLQARFGSRRPARWAARADVALGADAWRGELDRAFGDARLGVDLPWHASVEGSVVVDLANDAAGESTARISRANATARARFAEGDVDVRLRGGLDDPVLTRSLADRLDLVLVRPVPGEQPLTAGELEDVRPFDERHWYVVASTDIRITGSLLLDANARADDGDDGYWSAGGDLGLRVLDLGPMGAEAWIRGQALAGSFVEGVGGEVGWLAPLSFAHVDLSYALDRWLVGPSGEASYAHRGRLSLMRRVGARWRSTLSLEGATGAGPFRVFAFLLVGYRI